MLEKIGGGAKKRGGEKGKAWLRWGKSREGEQERATLKFNNSPLRRRGKNPKGKC